MTIEELASLSADNLEKLSDKELEETLKPYFNVTRPEFAVKPSHKDNPILHMSEKKREALILLQEQGVDLSFLKRGRK